MHGDADDPAWSDRQRLLVRLADELHATATVSRRAVDGRWPAVWTDEQLVELLALAGFYHLVSFMANAAGVELRGRRRAFPGDGSG